MKLLHVITTVDVGGAEMHILSQVRGQVARGHQVRVVYLLGKGALKPDFMAAGVELLESVGRSPLALWRLRKHLRWSDIVHTHLLRADFIGAFAATLWGKRKALISGKHNDERALQRKPVGFIHGIFGRLPKRTIVLSEHVVRYMQEFGRLRPEGMVCIRYGIDAQPFERTHAQKDAIRRQLRSEFGFGPDDVIFLCVARLAPQKAHDVLLAATQLAVQEFQGRGHRLRLLIVGDDPFGDGRERVTGWAKEKGLLEDGTCVLTGIRRDVPDLLAASDVFVMPSRWEGLGLVFLEAMATGLPVLSTNVSAIPEVVIDNKTGVLVEPEDAKGLAKAMVELADNGEWRATLGERGRRRVHQEFGLDTMVDKTLEVYRDLHAESDPGGQP